MQRLGIIDYFGAIANFIGKTSTMVELEARKLQHDYTDLFTRAVQPALWLLIVGPVLASVRAIPTGNLPYIDFMAPGILAQSVLFISIFYGIATIWERDLGIIHKFLVTPTYRSALVLGKALSAGERGLAQAAIVYILAFGLGVKLSWSIIPLLLGIIMIILGSALFSTFSLIIACLVKTRERFMGIGQVLTNPLFFASNAIYPLSIMPNWLQVVARVNPLTYMVDALRALMLSNGPTVYTVPFDFLFMAGALVINVAIASKLYPRVII